MKRVSIVVLLQVRRLLRRNEPGAALVYAQLRDRAIAQMEVDDLLEVPINFAAGTVAACDEDPMIRARAARYVERAEARRRATQPNRSEEQR